MKAKKWFLGDLPLRSLSAFVLILLALGSLRGGETLFVFFWFCVVFLIFIEWQKVIHPQKMDLSFLSGGTLLGSGMVSFWMSPALWGGVASGTLLWIFWTLWRPLPLSVRLWSIAGFFYAGFLGASVLFLRFSEPAGSVKILWLFALVWSTDSFAYLGGRLCGGPKLWIRLSPSKTWSGFVIGVAAGTSVGLSLLWGIYGEALFLGPAWALCFCTSLLSQAGDLFESAFKRHFKVKDTSDLIPGHGGIMDRLDGFSMAAGFIALLFFWKPFSFLDHIFL